MKMAILILSHDRLPRLGAKFLFLASGWVGLLLQGLPRARFRFPEGPGAENHRRLLSSSNCDKTHHDRGFDPKPPFSPVPVDLRKVATVIF